MKKFHRAVFHKRRGTESVKKRNARGLKMADGQRRISPPPPIFTRLNPREHCNT
ncbi:hypothetical protein HAL09_09530 [Helicobacter ailurogastricus]|uniref:Uncharacterized protein n=1 Tax=Helicobacter ailurogastricus TaxID=1578720 RepID=A0A0K2XI41_9HELI|nr:hypothetical protein HAL09_09530 [Helicobacter ailurogastricus]